MSFIVVDVESDGPVPGLYSMVNFGAVVVRDGLEDTYYSGVMKPISDDWIPDSLAVSGYGREDMLNGRDPQEVMKEFNDWIKNVCVNKPILISDNNQFDGMFMSYYFHKFVGSNPFGWSSRRIGDMFAGIKGDTRAQWKYLRITKHTHHPLDDAKGNAEVILRLRDEYKLKIKLV